jgi:O-antigen ligase
MNIRIQKFLLYLFSITLVFESWNGVSYGGNSIPKLVAIFLIIALLFGGGKQEKLISIRQFIIPISILGILIVIISLFNYKGDPFTMLLLPGVVLNIVIFIFILRFIRANPLAGYQMLQLLVVGILGVSILFLIGIGVDYEEGRLSIFGENSNKVGLYAIIAILFVLSTVFENAKKYRYRYLLLITIAPLLNMIAQSGSRVTFVSFILLLLLFFILRGGKNTTKKIVFLVVGVVSVYLAFSYLMSFDILRNRMLNTVEDRDLSGRDLIWETYFPLVQKNPVFGVGLSGFTETSLKNYNLFVSPHNVFLEVLIYSGIIGFIFFALFLYRILRYTYYIMKDFNFSLPLLLVLLVILACFSGQFLNVKPFWMILAFALSVPKEKPRLSSNA